LVTDENVLQRKSADSTRSTTAQNSRRRHDFRVMDNTSSAPTGSLALRHRDRKSMTVVEAEKNVSVENKN